MKYYYAERDQLHSRASAHSAMSRQAEVCAILWDGAYKRSLAANRNEVAAAGLLSAIRVVMSHNRKQKCVERVVK